MSDFLKALHNTNNESAAWRNSPRVGAPPRSWWVSIESLLKVAAEERPDQQFCKPIADLVDAYLNAINKAMADEMSFEPDLTNEEAVKALEIALAPIGRALALLNLAEKNGPLEEPSIESIKTLHKENVPFEQIARIWGIKAYQVEQYLDGGKWQMPANHVSPTVIDWRQERKKEVAAYDAAAYRWKFNSGESLFRDDVSNEVEEDTWVAPPESVQQLLSEGVDVGQVARMWRMSVAEVEAVRDGNSVGDLQPVGADEEELEKLTAPEPKKGKR